MPHQGSLGQNGWCESSSALRALGWAHVTGEFDATLGGKKLVLPSDNNLKDTWLWHQDNLLLAAFRNIIYLISHEVDSFKCVLYQSSKALCSVWSATNVQKMFYFESTFYFCTVFMDSAVNVTILWEGETHQSSCASCIKYASIRDHVTHFTEAEICKLLKC